MLVKLLGETVTSLALIHEHVAIICFTGGSRWLTEFETFIVLHSEVIALVVADTVVEVHQIAFIHILRLIYRCLRFMLGTYNFREPATRHTYALFSLRSKSLVPLRNIGTHHLLSHLLWILDASCICDE